MSICSIFIKLKDFMICFFFFFFQQGRENEDGEPESKKASLEEASEGRHRLVHCFTCSLTKCGMLLYAVT